MKSSKRDIVMNAGVGVAMAILIVIGYLYYLNVRAMTEFDQMVERSQAVILKLEGLLSAMKDVENGEHIFTITGDERSLEPYRAAIGQIERHLATLKTLTKNHPAQQNLVYRVEPLIRERLAEAAKTIDVRQREGYRAASQREFSGQHKLLTGEIRGQLDEAQSVVMRHLDKRKALKEASTRSMILAVLAGSSLSFVLLLTIYILLKRDITKRKRAEEKFRGLLESAPEAVVIVNDKGEICLVNSQTENLFGYDREELYGQAVEMLVPERFRDIHANHRADYFLNPGVRRMGTGTELYGLRKDGSEFPADISLSPLITDEGVLVIATLRDISEARLMEETLRFSEARYRALFRDNPTMIVTLDADLKLLTVNPICTSQLGYTLDELEGRPVLELFFEDDRSAVDKQLRMCLQNPGQVNRWQFRKIRKDKELLWVEETAQAFYDVKGSLNLLVVCQDITERKRLEDELKDSNMQNELILACAGEGIIGLDLEGNQTFVNASAAAMLGYEVNELVGRHSHSMWHCAKHNGSPYPEEKCPVYAAYKEGSVHSGEDIFFRKDGTGFPVLFTSRPIFYDEKITGAVLTFNDISQLKRVEEELRKSENRYRTLFNAIDEGFCIIELIFDENEKPIDYRFLETNPAFEKQTGLFNAQGKRMRELAPAHEEYWYETYGKTALTGQPACFQHLAEQLHRWYDVYAFRFGQPEHRQVAILFNDITENKQAEEEIKSLNASLTVRAAELEEANQELEAFNYSVAHDLRNPLNVISSYCQVIKELCGDKLDEQCMRYLQETYNGTLRMNRLIEALLNFSRLAHTELNRERVDLGNMAREVAEELKGMEPARQVTFQISDRIVTNGDANLLRVVLTNLLGNAWKYTGMRDVGIIEFGVEEINGNPLYFVRDNGAGFDMADAAKLFAPFQRLSGAEECRGFGIGLATVERIIRRHGGNVCAEGEPGKGATFYFSLSADGVPI